MAFYPVGTKVAWESQAGGSTTRKEGVVVATYDQDPRNFPMRYARKHFPDHRKMFDGFTWHPDGVLVEVRDGKTARAKPKLYMPHPGKLGRPLEPAE